MSTQEQLFDPSKPLPKPDGLEAWREHLKTETTKAELDSYPLSRVKERDEKLLGAIDQFAEISKLRGLGKIATDPDLAGVFEKRASSYEDGVLATHIAPAADKKWRSNSRNELNGLVADVVGDVETARKSAWADFTVSERGRLGIEPENMDSEELASNLRAFFAGPDGSKNRAKYRKLLGANQNEKPKKKAA